MKQFEFLFNHPTLFIIVWVVAGLDTLTGIVAAIVQKKFEWNLLSLWVQKVLNITLAMVAANIVEYFIAQGGYSIEGFGIIGFAGTYILQELKSMQINLDNIWSKPKEI